MKFGAIDFIQKPWKSEKLISEDDLKRGEEDTQKLTDKINEEITSVGIEKEKEIMEI